MTDELPKDQPGAPSGSTPPSSVPLEFPPNWEVEQPGTVITVIGTEAFRRSRKKDEQ